MYRDAEGFWRVTTIRLRRIVHARRIHVETLFQIESANSE